MLQRLIRLVGWACYGLGGLILSFSLLLISGSEGEFEPKAIIGIAIALLMVILGRGIIYVAVGPRRNPF
jgi:hypothetical protein